MDSRKKQNQIATTTKSDLVLKKHVGLIHCENKLTLVQRKICNILLFNALDKIHDQDIYEISIRNLSNLVGYNSNDSKQIKESVKTLISTVMEWNLLEDNKFLDVEGYAEDSITWHASALLAGASIKNGIIRYSYSPQMKSVLSSLDIYGRINLFVQSKFSSAYSLVLYENCVRFKNIKHTSWFTMDLFRSLMGVPETKYSLFKDFNRKVINVAIKEINQKSDIYIEPKFQRVSRKVSAIQFTVQENDNYKPSFKKRGRQTTLVREPKKSPLIIEELISEFGLQNKQAEDIMSVYALEYVLEKIRLVRSKKRVIHRGAYLISALKQDYKTSEKKIEIATNSPNESSYIRETKEASEIAPLRNKYISYKLKTYLEYIQTQTAAIQNSINEKFEKVLQQNTLVFRSYKKSGLRSPFVTTNFVNFIDEHFPDIVGDYLSFDDYITSEEV